MTKRYDSPDWNKPQAKAVEHRTFGPFTLVWWGMWADIKVWDLREIKLHLGIKGVRQAFFMIGPWELRWQWLPLITYVLGLTALAMIFRALSR